MRKSKKSVKNQEVEVIEVGEVVEVGKEVVVAPEKSKSMVVLRGNGKIHIHESVNNVLRSLREEGVEIISVDVLRKKMSSDSQSSSFDSIKDSDLSRILSDRKCRGWIVKESRGVFKINHGSIKFSDVFGDLWSDRDVN